MTFKIIDIREPQKFFERLKECTGQVTLITGAGDVINLKSKLCQYIALLSVFTDPVLKDVEIYCEDPHDATIIMDFLVGR